MIRKPSINSLAESIGSDRTVLLRALAIPAGAPTPKLSRPMLQRLFPSLCRSVVMGFDRAVARQSSPLERRALEMPLDDALWALNLWLEKNP